MNFASHNTLTTVHGSSRSTAASHRRLPLLALGLLLSLLAARPAAAQVTVSEILSNPGNSSVTTPEASFVDIYGNIFLVNTVGTSISEIPANGSPIVTIASGLSPVAQGVAADNQGNVYITQKTTATIMKISPSGVTTTIGSGLNNPFGMTFDSSGNLYVADGGAIKIIKITPAGVQTTLAFSTSNINNPHYVVVDSAGDVFTGRWASSTNYPTVTELSASGTQITYFLTTGSSATPIPEVNGLAVDSTGGMYVVNAGIIYYYSAPSTSPNSYVSIPACAACSSAANVNLTSRGDLVYMTSSGIFSIQSLQSPLTGSGVSNFYGTLVGSTSKATAITYNFTSGVTLGTAPIFTSNNSSTIQFKDYGTGDTCTSKKVIAAGGTCTLYVTFSPLQTGLVTGTVSLVSSTGTTLATTYLTGVGDAPVASFTPGAQSALLSGLGTPAGVAVDSAGNVYLADTTRNIVTKTTSGGVTTTLPFTGLARPYGLAVDGAGTVYVSDSVNNAVYTLTVANVQATLATTGLSAPRGITLDGYNNLYIADSGNSRVVRLDISGNQVPIAFSGLAAPSWLAVDTFGDIYVSDTGKIFEIPYAGSQKTITASGLSAAAGITVSPSGSLYIADSGNGDVFVIPATGSPFTLASGLKTAAGLAVAPAGNLYIADASAAQLVLLDRSKASLAFPPTATGVISAPMAVAVQNTGNSALTTSALAVTSGYILTTPALATDCTATTSLLPAAVCNIDVEFTPSALGPISGTATLTDNALNATTATQTVSLTGNGIKASVTTLGLTTPATGNPVYGQAIIVTATVAPATSTGTPTGSVTFSFDGGSPGAPVSLNGGQATFSPSQLAVGTHTVVAVYSGDSSFAASTSTSFTITVTPAVLTVTAISQMRSYGVANAPLTYSITGFAYSDTNAVVSGAPVLSTTATTTSDPGSFPVTITAGTLAAANYTFTLVPGTITVTTAANTITFPAIAGVTYGAFPIAPLATASSGLAINYSVTGPATVTSGAGAAITITGAGTVKVTATQAGNTDYAAATSVSQSFTVTPAVLTVTATSLSKQSGQANPTLVDTFTGFVNNDTSSVVSGAAVISTTVTTSSPVGTYPITITQGTLAAANYTFNLVPGTLTITGTTPQTITFAALPGVTYGNAPVVLTATSSSSLALTYSVTGPAMLSGSTVVITGTGTVSVTASQLGNNTYAAATSVTQSFTVAKAALAVNAPSVSRYINTANPVFAYTIAGYVNGDTSAVISGAPAITTTAGVSSPVGTYPITVAIGTLSASNYTFTFNSATLTVVATPQTITFATLPNVVYGVAPITLAATASSSLAVAYTVTGPASVSGSTLTITGIGSVSVTAAQPGNAAYAAASSVTQSFTVTPAPLTVTATNASIAYGVAIPTTFTYTITGYVYSETSAVVSGTPVISTTAIATSPGGAYPITPTIGTLAAANYSFATFVPGTLTIQPTGQTITFAALPNIPQTTSSVTLSATASSGLPVVFALVSGPATLNSSTGMLAISGPGTVVVTATQPGNSSYSAAAPVTQSFSVTGTTSTSLTLSTTTANFGSTVTLTAKVTGSITGSIPTGTVSFYAYATLLGSPVTISSSGSATLNTTAIPSGNIKITAVYSGDNVFSSSTSTYQAILIVSPTINISATSTNLTISAGQSVSTTITLTPVGGYSYLVNFSCGALPAYLTCTFNPAALSFYPGTYTTTVPQSTTLTLNDTQVASLRRPHLSHASGSGMALAVLFGAPILALSFFGGRRRRRSLCQMMLLSLLVLFSVGGIVSLSGCGSGTPSVGGTYNIQVIVDDGTGITHTLALTVTMQ
ncbi:MAG: MBG domain-containing protein [Acidobacteriaceae bacterium]|nr:MBG domain-containing protein [Acidobacteriaceae bacterium]